MSRSAARFERRPVAAPTAADWDEVLLIEGNLSEDRDGEEEASSPYRPYPWCGYVATWPEMERAFAVELEFYAPAAEVWTLPNCGQDGSLTDVRQGEEGAEYRSGPVTSFDGMKEVTRFCHAARKAGGRVDKTCGHHVHVDVNDLPVETIAKVVQLYDLLEPALYQIVPPSRREGRYAKPRNRGFHRHSYRECQTESRYYGLNLESIQKHGTLEFRLAAGTLNARKVFYWVLLCHLVVETGISITRKGMRHLRSLAVIDPMLALLKVAKYGSLRRWIAERHEEFGRGAGSQVSGIPAPVPTGRRYY